MRSGRGRARQFVLCAAARKRHNRTLTDPAAGGPRLPRPRHLRVAGRGASKTEVEMSAESEQNPIRDNLRRRESWLRALYVVLFAVIYSVTEIVIVIVVVVQFGFVLLTGKCNEQLLGFGASLSRYVFELLRFVTFNSDTKPFPFSPWPAPDVERAAPAGRRPARRASKKKAASARDDMQE